MRLIKFLCFLLFCSINNAQAPVSSIGLADFCGFLSIPKPKLIRNEPFIYDRFGNVFSKDALLVQPQSRYPLTDTCSTVQNTSYFVPTFIGNPPVDVQCNIIETLNYISSVVAERDKKENLNNENCSNATKVNIAIVWVNFTNPYEEFENDLLSIGISVEEVGELQPTTAGIASGIYDYGSGNFLGTNIINNNRAYHKLNAGLRPDQIGTISYDGYVLINSSPSNQSCGDIDINTDISLEVLDACVIDLFNVTLHELLHVLGISSIAANLTLPNTESAPLSLWDANLTLTVGAEENPERALLLYSQDNLDYDLPLIGDLSAYHASDCSDIVIPHITAGRAPVATEGSLNNNSLRELVQQFSHLKISNSCLYQEDYVMTRTIPFFNPRRTITDTELSILCDMGYRVTINNEECNGCYIVPIPLTFDSDIGCSPIISMDCVLDTLEIPFSMLTQTVSYNSEIYPFGEGKITSLAGGNELEEFTILYDETEQVYRVFLSGTPNTYLSTVALTINVTNCNSDIVYTVSNFIQVDWECFFGCNFQENEICEQNLVCPNDFEDYDFTQNSLSIRPGDPYPELGETLVPGGYILVRRNGDEFYMEFVNSSPSSALFTLSDQIGTGQSYQFSFDYIKTNNSILEVWGLEYPPCPLATGIPLSDQCGDITDCGTYLLAPECLVELPINGVNDLEPTNNTIGQVIPTITYSGVFEATTPINYLFFVLRSNSDVLPPRANMDNVIVNKEDYSNLVQISQSIIQSVCANQTSFVAYRVCADEDEVTVYPNLVLPDGVGVLSPMQDSIVITGGECQFLTYETFADENSTIGEYPITLNLTSFNVCGESASFSQSDDIGIVECASPCAENDVISVGSFQGRTHLSQLIAEDVFPENSISNTVVSVNGTLIVNVNYIIDQCEFIFSPGARLVVQRTNSQFSGPELTIINSNSNGGLHGCDRLWQGIEVYGEAKLLIDNSTIQDAVYGVRAFHKSIASITNTRFRDNYVGLYFENETEWLEVFLLEDFYGNSFGIERISLLPRFSGQAVETSSKPFAGVYLDGNFYTTFLGRGGDYPKNRFESICNGIISKNTPISLVGFEFKDILTDNSQGYPITGFGIHHIGLPSDFLSLKGDEDLQSVEFNNCSVGISTNSVDTYIEDSEFLNCTLGVESRGLSASTIKVRNNSFVNEANPLGGITLFSTDLLDSVIVSDNTIDFTGTNPLGSTYGISVVESMFNGDYEKVIHNNSIEIGNTGEGAAILLNSANSWNISSNTISIAPESPAFAGIITEGLTNSVISENTITGTSAQFGIGINLSEIGGGLDVTLACNTLESLNIGLRVNGIWGSTFINGTVFDGDFNDGLLYGSSVRIGQQRFQGNTWSANSTYTRAAATNLLEGDENPVLSLDAGRFFVEANSSFMPASFAFPNWPVNQWQFLSPLWFQAASEDIVTCDSILINTISNVDEASIIAGLSEEDFDSYPELWDLHHIFGMSVFSHPEKIPEEALSKYLSLIKEYDARLLEVQCEKGQHKNMMRPLQLQIASDKAELVYIASVVQEINEDSSTDELQSIKKELLEIALNLKESLFHAEKQVINSSDTYSSSKKLEFSSILSSQHLNRDVLLQFNLLDFTSRELIVEDARVARSLYQAATLCPTDHPLIVARARSWLRRLYPAQPLPIFSCEGARRYSQAGLNDQTINKVSRKELIVFPNPTTNQEIRIRVPGSGVLTIIDALGKIMYQNRVHSNDSELKISLDDTGVFFLLFNQEEGNMIKRVIVQ